MKTKNLTLLASLLLLVSFSFAQVSHVPQNRNFLIERGTGLACGSCPKITLFCDTVIDVYHPGRGMLIEYHTGPDARPQGGGINDFQTMYGDSLEHTIKFGLNMAVNRIDRSQGNYNNYVYIFSPNLTLPQTEVALEADNIVNQPSPINLWMNSSYDPQTRQITVNVEVYYTGNAATPNNMINVLMTEDSVIGKQYDGMYPGWNPAFNHMNLFRANITPMWGDSIHTTTQGTTIGRTYTYTVPPTYGAPNYTTVCNPLNCNLTLCVTEEKNTAGGWNQKPEGKVITAIRTHVGDGPLSVSIEKKENNIHLYPNPSSGMVYLDRNEPGEYGVEVIDVLGNRVYSADNLSGNRGKIDLSGFSNGMYFVKVGSATGISTHKIMIAK